MLRKKEPSFLYQFCLNKHWQELPEERVGVSIKRSLFSFSLKQTKKKWKRKTISHFLLISLLLTYILPTQLLKKSWFISSSWKDCWLHNHVCCVFNWWKGLSICLALWTVNRTTGLFRELLQWLRILTAYINLHSTKQIISLSHFMCDRAY